MDTALTQPLSLTRAPRRPFWKSAKATLEAVARTLEASARAESYERVLGAPDASTLLGSLSQSEREQVLMRGHFRTHA